MKKENLLCFFTVFMFISGYAWSQDGIRDIYGWLRFDTRHQDKYGICKFTSDAPEDITVIYPHAQNEVACAGAFADNKYYVYLYEPLDGGQARPISFNYVDLSTGQFKQVADYRNMSTLYSDMTYDYSTKTMYALGKAEGDVSALLKVDLVTGKSTPVGNMDRLYITLACTYEGEMYAIDLNEGALWKVEKGTAHTSLIGNTYELPSAYLQSMEFDHETNTLYWAGNDTRDYGFLDKIDIKTGEAQQIGTLGNDAQVVGLYIPFKKTAPDAPAGVTNLTVVAGANGELTAELSWENPSLNFAGSPLSSLTKIEIYRNEQPVHEINNPVRGERMSWKDEGVTNGITTYRVSAINEKGESSVTSNALFVGRDVPVAPSRATLKALSDKSAKITWDTPEIGMNGGWIDVSALTYKITRLPDQVVFEETITGNEFTDTTITSLNNYSYEIQSVTSDGEGGKVVTNSLIMGPALTVPYSCDFETDEVFALWNVIDANDDGYTWKRETTLAAACYYYNEDEVTGGDDWLISSPIHLEKGKLYRLSFKLQSYDVGYPEKVGVYLGTGKTVAQQTTLLGDYEVESNTFISYKVMLPEEVETGDYYLSFHCHSEPYMFILYLADLLLEEVSEGGISGSVTDGRNPLSDVEVCIKETGKKELTDENGRYEFKELKTGSYTLVFNKKGYRSIERTNTEVTFGETTEVNAALEALPTYSVSGKVLNINRVPVDKAKIFLNGYAEYIAGTDTDGAFIVPEVYQADDYILIVERYGLSNDTIKLNVKDSNIVLEDILLKDKPLPPYLLRAELQGDHMKLDWKEPVDTREFRHDNGIHGGRLGTTSSTAKSVYGSVFRTPAKLTGMTWFTENYLLTHPTVNLFVFDLDPEGEPTSTILYSRMNVPNKDMEWTTFEFPQPVDAPNGYMLALSYEGHVGLGLDNGEGPDYPFALHTNCYAEDYTTGKFTYTEEHDIKRSLMIRGIGILRGDDELPSVTSEKKYCVWRLKEEQIQTPEQWELLTTDAINTLNYTDTKWSDQKQGFYRYAVKTIYNKGEIFSPVAFTRTLTKDMLTQIILNVDTNTPENKSKGAKVVLLNTDNNPEHVYNGIVDAQGRVSFTDVWKGIYQIRITLEGFEDCFVETEDFSTEKKYDKSGYVLQEYIVNPFNLEIVKTGQEQKRMFNWNVKSFLFDDFESHMDFAINSSGSIGWNYIDGDGKETYGIDGVKYINATLPMAYIIFNPYETDPNSGFIDKNIRPYSGNKYLASFPAHPGPNNDFFISPELKFNKDFVFKFYAKSYTEDFGMEQMNIGYSVTGNGIGDFIWLNGGQPISIPMGEWKEYRYLIPADAKYVTINCVSDNIFIFMVDDVFIGIELPEGVDLDKMKKDISFEVYLDGEKLATTNQTGYLLQNLIKGKHKAGVKAIFSSVTTPLAEVEFEIEEGNGICEVPILNRTISPNPARDLVNISGEYDYVSIYDLSGNELIRHPYGNQIHVRDLGAGIYMMKIISGNSSETVKLIVDR